MNRAQLQQLAAERIADAEALLVAGRPSGAYHLAGYAVECGLKACIARLTNQYDFPDKRLANQAYVHNLEQLVAVANLTAQLTNDRRARPRFDAHWVLVKDWSEESRYQLWTPPEARAYFSAVTDTADGVLPWIAARW